MANLREAFEYASKNPNSDFARNLQDLASSGALNLEAKKYGIDLSLFNPPSSTPEQPKEEPKFTSAGIPANQSAQEARQQTRENIADFIGGKELSQGIGQSIANPQISKDIEQTQAQAIDIQTQLLNRIKEKKASGEDTTRLQQALDLLSRDIGTQGEQAGQLLNQENLTSKEVIGSAIQLGALATPLAGAKAGLGAKTLSGAATGYLFDVGGNLRDNKELGEALKPGIATVVGGALPVTGRLINKLIAKPLGKVSKGLASAFSGASDQNITAILKDPKTAARIKKVINSGNKRQVLEREVDTIVNGVSKIKREASKAFGEGLESLSKTDIKPSVFRENIQGFLDDFGILRKDGKRVLSGVEFSDPKNIKKANKLIDKLQNVELDGKSIRKLADDIENAAYRTATSDERLSFNIFVRNLSEALRSSIIKSTEKLGEINAKYSADIQLADAIQDIFGKLKYKNLSEINQVAKRLESLFNEKGLSDDIIDDFFNRIGESSAEFRASEATRQLSNKSLKANSPGSNPFEIFRNVTAGIVTPQIIRDISIITGKTQPVVKKILEGSSNTAKKALLESLTQ